MARKLEAPKSLLVEDRDLGSKDRIRLVINSRPASFKTQRKTKIKRKGTEVYTNKRGRMALRPKLVVTNSKTDYAQRLLEDAQWELKSQWKGKKSQDLWELEIFYYFKDFKSWPDPDACYGFVIEAMKESVIEDDSYDYVGDTYLHLPRLSRLKKDYIEIYMTKAEDQRKPKDRK